MGPTIKCISFYVADKNNINLNTTWCLSLFSHWKGAINIVSTRLQLKHILFNNRSRALRTAPITLGVGRIFIDIDICSMLRPSLFYWQLCKKSSWLGLIVNLSFNHITIMKKCWLSVKSIKVWLNDFELGYKLNFLECFEIEISILIENRSDFYCFTNVVNKNTVLF